MYSKSENIMSVAGSDTKELIKVCHKSIFTTCQQNMSEKMKGRDFVFGYTDKFYYNCYKITLNRSGSYIDSTK